MNGQILEQRSRNATIFFAVVVWFCFSFFSRLLSKLLIGHFSPLHLVCMNNSFFCFVLFISAPIFYIGNGQKKGIFPSIIKKKWIQIKWIVVNKLSELKIFEHTPIFLSSSFFRCKKCRFSGYKTFTVDCCFFWKASRFFLHVTIF